MTKSKFKALFISILLAAVAVCLSVGLAACKGGDKGGGKYGVGEEGVYYYDKDSSTEYLMTLQSGNYMISAEGAKSYSGTYSYKEDSKSVSFKTDGGESFDATFSDDVMQLAIEGTPYTFLKRVSYTVTFVDGNASTAQSVTYGKQASAPEKDESRIFIGWYEDSSFTMPYKFDTAVTGDLTLYAYYIDIDSTIANYEVSFVADGETVYTTETQNGIVYDIPDYDGILGWWVSDTNDGDALTYKYDGRTLTEATKLFAVKEGSLGASVYDDKITWEATVNSVTVTIDGGESFSATGNSQAYDFASLGTGVHDILISGGSYSEELVYVVNGLSRVSNFSVYGNVLVYNAVENAQYYYISVSCGNPSHDHEMVYNGNTLTYDFSNCEMGKEGISFTVYAYASGYVESVSETYVYSLSLDDATVTIDTSADKASWTAVQGASGYEVYMDGEYVETITGTEYSFKYFDIDTEIKISVKPVAPGYYSEASAEVSYKKSTLRTPEITGINAYTVSWSYVEEATNYIIYVNGKQFETVSGDITSYVLMGDPDFIEADSYVITVRAVNAGNTNQNSQLSDEVYATDGELAYLLVYEDGVVYWQYAMAAGTYYVSVNDGDETAVEGKNSFPVTFDRSGENVIKVWFTDAEGHESLAQISVTAYAVIFNSEGGSIVDTMYVAKGDTLKLDTPVYAEGAGSFLGWYTLPNPNGLALDVYMGEGVQVSTGDVFDRNSTLILYACWEVSKQNVTLFVGDYGELDDTSFQMPVNTEEYTMPVPECIDQAYQFVGWYSEANGRGTRYTDENGNSLNMYTNVNNKTIYAYWAQVLKFSPAKSSVDGSEILEVSYGPDIAMVTSVTVPAEYNGVKVANLGSSAFKNCTTLTAIYLPDTIEYISTVNNGYASGSGAFAGASKIEGVYIYETGEPATTKEVWYYSDDAGALFELDSVTGYVELVYYPYARTGAYVIPEVVYNSTELEYVGTNTQQVVRSVTSIATQVFASNTKITAVTIPATIENIDTQAFYKDTKMETLTFNDTVENENAVAATTLTIGANAFQGCKLIAEVTLPARLSDFKASMFTDCSALENIYVSENNATYSSKDGMLYNNAGNELLCCPAGRSGEVAIQAGTTVIGESAFASITTITGVTIPASMQEIGAFAFKGCTKIEYVKFEGGDNSQDLTICEGAFYGITSSLFTELELPSNLVKMEVNAFGGCTKLTTVTVHARALDENRTENSVDFAKDAFGSTATTTAYYVTTVYLDKYVPEFAIADVFGKKLEHVYIEDGNAYYSSDEAGVVYNTEKTTIIYYPLELSGDYIVPSTVTKISASVFEARTGLTGIYIPSSVVEIGEEAFYGCTKLAFVTFEAGGTEDLVIGEYAFRGCTALAEISFPERTITIGDNALYGCTKLTYVYIPSTVTALGGYDSTGKLVSMNVFYNCSKLEKIEVGEGSASFMTIDGVLYAKDSQGNPTELIVCPTNNAVTDVVISGTVTRVWDKAFYNNTSVETVSFSGEVTLEKDQELFGESVFEGSTNLRKVELPVGLTNIAAKLFYKCTSLVEVIIPYTVAYIGKAAFFQCTSLTTVVFSDTPEGTAEAALVFEDCETDSTYTGSDYYYYYYGTFSRCESLEEIILPDRTTALGEYMFAGYQYYNSKVTSYSGLKSVTIGANVTEIADGAFRYADKLSEIKFAEGSQITKIGEYAFSFTGEIENFVIPETVVEIGDYAFRSSGIMSVTLPSGITEISGDCFRGCANLKEITIPANVESLKTASVGAFYECGGLESITFEEGSKLEEIESYCFWYCTSLKEITLPASIQTIGACAFWYCTSLTSINFDVNEDGYSQLASIGNSAFAYTAITEFVFPETTATSISLGTTLFQYCTKVTSITLSNGVTDLGTSLSKCNTITEVDFNRNDEGEQTNVNYKVDEEYPILYSYSGESIALVFGEIVGEFTVPYYVKSLGANLFQNQVSLTAVYIPTSVESIGDSAFASCTSLENVYFYSATYVDDDGNTVPVPAAASVTLGTYVFAYTAIKEINLSADDVMSMDGKTTLEGTNITKMGNACVAYCESLQKVYLPAISSSSNIGTYMYAYDTSLTDVVFSDTGSYYLGQRMFAYCPSLVSVTIPANVTGMTTYVFQGAGIVTADLSECGVATLGNYIFDSCSSLTTVILGDKITNTGTYAFQNCTSLAELVLPGTVTTLGNYVFNGATNLSKIAKTEEELAAADGGYIDISSVTSLGTYAFKGCEKIVEVVLSEKVTTIGAQAFYGCVSLATIDLSHVTTLSASSAFYGCTSLTFADLSSVSGVLGTGTFSGCTALEAVVLGTGITAIGAYNDSDGSGVFQGAGLKTVTYTGYDGTESFELPSSITLLGRYCFNSTQLERVVVPALTYYSSTGTSSSNKLGNNVFANCLNLTTVSFADGATAVGGYMFDGCTALTSIVLPSDVKDIGPYGFRNSGLSSIEMPGVTTIATYAFYGCQFTSIELSEKVTSIGTYMFAYNTSLVTADLSKLTVETLTANSFQGCSALESVTLSSYTIKINGSAFKECESLESINTAKVTSLNSNVFEECSSLESIDLSGLTNTYIYADCFLNCTSLATVSLPSTIVKIYKEAFMGCTSLESVSFVGEVNEIRDNAFSGCSSLKEILLPETLTTIGNEVFSDCGLTSINLPAALTSLGNYVFVGCLDLEEIKVDPGNTKYQVLDGVLCDMAGGIIFYPVNLIEDGNLVISEQYSLTSYAFKGYTQLVSVTIPGTITSIPTYTFDACTNLTTVVIEEGVEEIGDYAFRNCENLSSITLPSTLKTLGKYVFRYDYCLTSIDLPEGLEEIGNYCFEYAGLVSVTLPSTMKTLGDYAFRYCSDLATITLNEGLESIGNSAFAYCTSLTYLEIPSTVTSIGTSLTQYDTSLTEVTVLCADMANSMFRYSENLVKATLAEGVETINQYAFASCTSLEEVIIPSTVTTIGNYAFDGCVSLNKVSGGENIESIGNYAFENTGTLEGFALTENTLTVGDYAFSGSALSSVVLYDTIESIGTNAFDGWDANQTIYITCSYYAAFNQWSAQYGSSAPNVFNALNFLKGCEANVVYDYVV